MSFCKRSPPAIMMFFYFTVLALLTKIILGNTITSLSSKTDVLEGENVTLSCNYSGTNIRSLQWYKQHSNTAPEFLLQTLENVAPQRKNRYVAEAIKDKKRMDLEISKTEVTDSVIYYCALVLYGGTNKVIFGSGTLLSVESKEVVEPSIYKVENSCLATDFTRHNALDDKTPFKNQNVTVRYEGHKTYSTFALRTNDNCEESNVCSGELSSGNDEIDIDEKINYMSLGIFWLRILFLKTVVFNVLITVKAWMR